MCAHKMTTLVSFYLSMILLICLVRTIHSLKAPLRKIIESSVRDFPYRSISRCNQVMQLSSGSPSSKISAQKRILLETVSKYQLGRTSKSTIISEINQLESSFKASDSTIKCADGTWSLIFSTMESDSNNSGAMNSFDLPDQIFKSIYKQIFRIAPFLAGSQDRSKAMDSLDSPITVTNTQIISLDSKTVRNDVKIFLKSLRQDIKVSVFGEVIALDQSTLEVIFTSCKISGINLPLPRPRGLLRTTFCDEDLRISRGGRGGIFLVKRM